LDTEQAIWQTVIFAAIVISGLVLIMIAYFERKTEGRWRRRKLQRGKRGEITQIGGVAIPEPLRVRGSGTYSARIELKHGRYKLSYQFAQGILTAIKIFEVQMGDEILMLAKSGAGEAELMIECDGKYIVEIDPTDGSAASELLISPLGLPIQHAAETPPDSL
jgi:hypothetical protein